MRLVALLEADLTDVIGAAVIRVDPFVFKLLDFAGVDAPDMADYVRKQFTLRILAEQPRVDFDARKAITVGGEARDLLVRQPRANRQALETFAFFHQLAEPAPVLRRDLNYG